MGGTVQLLQVILLIPWTVASSSLITHLKLNSYGQFEVEEREPGWQGLGGSVVTANYTNKINETGWAFLDLTTNGDYPDKIQAFAAGYLEGYVTSDLLYMSYLNTIVGRCDGKEQLCKTIDSWVSRNRAWVEKKIRHHAGTKSYWHHVSLFYSQMAGIAEGFATAMRSKNQTTKTITLNDIVTMNIFGDLEDLESALGDSQTPAKLLGQGHCSALLRLLPGNTELLAAHDTWNSYQSMLRILKRYSLPYRVAAKSGARVPGHTMSFSGYPGVVYSGDDFTVISSGLTTIETTIGNSNPALWPKVKPESVLEGIRSTVANRLATTGEEWTNIFSLHNSGTYNNQWMVIDYNRFVPGAAALSPGLIWILEQIPGYIRAEDLTGVVGARGFWPSYNSPYFADVYNMSGNYELWQRYGDWFSYAKTPRARIFEREAGGVADLAGMVRLMRYNNYQKDPVSACDCSPPYSAENAISARNDLNPRNGTYPFPALGHRSHGGTDMKVTSASLAARLEFVAQAGPTWDPLPPFRWSQQDFVDTPHVGHPDLWQFQPVADLWA